MPFGWPVRLIASVTLSLVIICIVTYATQTSERPADPGTNRKGFTMQSGAPRPATPEPCTVVITAAAALIAFGATLIPDENDLWHIEPMSAEGRDFLAGVCGDRARAAQLQDDFAGTG